MQAFWRKRAPAEKQAKTGKKLNATKLENVELRGLEGVNTFQKGKRSLRFSEKRDNTGGM